MGKIRYYTYLETLKKLTGEQILFGNSDGDDERKIRIVSERFKRITDILLKKEYIDNSVTGFDDNPDPEEIYTRLSLMMVYLKNSYRK